MMNSRISIIFARAQLLRRDAGAQLTLEPVQIIAGRAAEKLGFRVLFPRGGKKIHLRRKLLGEGLEVRERDRRTAVAEGCRE